MNHLIENAPVAIGKFRPKFQVALNRFWIERGKHARLKVSDAARLIGDVIAESVADRLAAGALVHNVTDRLMNFFNRVSPAEHEEQRTRPLSISFASKILEHVIAN